LVFKKKGRKPLELIGVPIVIPKLNKGNLLRKELARMGKSPRVSKFLEQNNGP